MTIRDRIKELRRVPASSLRPNGRNWRTHPRAQRAALEGILQEIGYADALLVRELEDGTLELIDGHLRAETTPDAIVPVLVLDVDDKEAEKILLTHDVLTKSAGVDDEALSHLLTTVETESAAVKSMLDKMADRYGIDVPALGERLEAPNITLSDSYQVIVECSGEEDQRKVFERMREEGYRCRVLTL